jgi:hypothetical protein
MKIGHDMATVPHHEAGSAKNHRRAASALISPDADDARLGFGDDIGHPFLGADISRPSGQDKERQREDFSKLRIRDLHLRMISATDFSLAAAERFSALDECKIYNTG